MCIRLDVVHKTELLEFVFDSRFLVLLAYFFVLTCVCVIQFRTMCSSFELVCVVFDFLFQNFGVEFAMTLEIAILA